MATLEPFRPRCTCSQRCAIHGQPTWFRRREEQLVGIAGWVFIVALALYRLVLR